MEAMRKERGQAAAELALALPVLIVIVLTMIDLGNYLVCATVADESATEAARTLVATCADADEARQAAVATAACRYAPGDVEAEVEVGPDEVASYEHHVSGVETARASNVTSCDASATVTIRSTWLTAAGRAIGAAIGQAGDTFSVTRTKSCTVDRTASATRREDGEEVAAW